MWITILSLHVHILLQIPYLYNEWRKACFSDVSFHSLAVRSMKQGTGPILCAASAPQKFPEWKTRSSFFPYGWPSRTDSYTLEEITVFFFLKLFYPLTNCIYYIFKSSSFYIQESITWVNVINNTEGVVSFVRQFFLKQRFSLYKRFPPNSEILKSSNCIRNT